MQQQPPSDCRSESSPTVLDIQSPTPTRLAVIADPHLATDASGTWKCYHRTEAFLERAVDEVRSREPDGIVVAGDLTKDGEPHNFRRYDELVDPLGSVVTIPGNHDVPSRTLITRCHPSSRLRHGTRKPDTRSIDDSAMSTCFV